MKNIIIFFILFIIAGCTSEKLVYWCGDHQCINKKERKAYFEKTMVVEVKKLKKRNYKNTSHIEKLLQDVKTKDNKKTLNSQSKLERRKLNDTKKALAREKKLYAKQKKLEEKRLIKEEKKLAKQIILEEKRLIKHEKKLNKQAKVNKNKLFKNEKKLIKKKSTKNLTKSNEIGLINFNDLVEKIFKKNALKSYPDINDVPN
jgi:hypothetical protein